MLHYCDAGVNRIGDTLHRGFMISEYYTLPEAARALGLERKTLWARVKNNTVAAEKLSGSFWLIHRTEVERLKSVQPGRPNKRKGTKLPSKEKP